MNEHIDYEAIRQDFIKCCPLLPKPQEVKFWTASRKTAVRNRLQEQGADALHEVFKKTGESAFMNGFGSRGWKASFDWVLKPQKFGKILEDSYSNANTGCHFKSIEKSSFDLEAAVAKATFRGKTL